MRPKAVLPTFRFSQRKLHVGKKLPMVNRIQNICAFLYNP